MAIVEESEDPQLEEIVLPRRQRADDRLNSTQYEGTASVGGCKSYRVCAVVYYLPLKVPVP